MQLSKFMRGFLVFLSAIDAWLSYLRNDEAFVKWERIEFYAALNGRINPWL
jgi:hypothetical protein